MDVIVQEIEPVEESAAAAPTSDASPDAATATPDVQTKLETPRKILSPGFRDGSPAAATPKVTPASSRTKQKAKWRILSSAGDYSCLKTNLVG